MVLVLLANTACVTIQQNEVGVRKVFGRLEKETLQPGLHAINMFTTSIERLPTYTQNLEISTSLPSMEGLSVNATISILYSIDPKMAHIVLQRAEANYEKNLILNIFRSAAADICAGYPAKAMHSGKRSMIELAIRTRMTEGLAPRGFIVEAVLLKTIQLPARLAGSIEQRLSAEQDAMRMRYVLEREEQEAKRKTIEAKGIRDAQLIRSQGITEKLLRLRYIEALERMARSNNSKIIFTGNKPPMLTQPITAPNEK